VVVCAAESVASVVGSFLTNASIEGTMDPADKIDTMHHVASILRQYLLEEPCGSIGGKAVQACSTILLHLPFDPKSSLGLDDSK